MPDVHGATMAAIAGLKPRLLLGARMGVLALTAVVAAAVSLATTALVFHADSWPIYAAANLLLAFTYGLIGAMLAPIFGRVGGVFIAFLLPFLDIGVVQSPMLHSMPTTLFQLLPGYGVRAQGGCCCPADPDKDLRMSLDDEDSNTPRA